MTPATPTPRQHWMQVLAKTPLPLLRTQLAPHLPDPASCQWLRRGETGLIMLRGRAGGTGQQFNLGEASLSRASVNIDGHSGHAWVLGSQPEHAELAAIADALLQHPHHGAPLQHALIAPLAAAIAARDTQRSREAAGSKVEFFTMVRGE